MRKIGDKLLKRLGKGDLMSLLNYVKSHNELRLEVRRNNEAFIYYKKGKALEVRKMKVDEKYGNVPPTNLATSNTHEYFERIKQAIDCWLNSKHFRREFDTQQKIAQSNQDKGDKYIIIDMEYAFEQHELGVNEREKKAVFDLLGIERQSGKIIFFEVKRGMGATPGKSGIDGHIKDFETYIHGKKSAFFRDNLIRDIENIVSDKIALGLITNYNLPNKLSDTEPEHIFVFHPDNSNEQKIFEEKLQGRSKLILVSNDDYKLR